MFLRIFSHSDNCSIRVLVFLARDCSNKTILNHVISCLLCHMRDIRVIFICRHVKNAAVESVDSDNIKIKLACYFDISIPFYFNDTCAKWKCHRMFYLSFTFSLYAWSYGHVANTYVGEQREGEGGNFNLQWNSWSRIARHSG